MDETEVRAIFALAGIAVQSLYEIKNEYASNRGDPWWLVKTKWGLIKIGWRKRVINIDWSDTPLRIKKDAIREYEFHMMPLVVNENITQDDVSIHAWSYGDAVKYVTEFKNRMGNWEYATSPNGVVDLAERKEKYETRKSKDAAAVEGDVPLDTLVTKVEHPNQLGQVPYDSPVSVKS
jgi:hypothetical protein